MARGKGRGKVVLERQWVVEIWKQQGGLHAGGQHTLHIFSSSSMRMKLSDRERGAGGSGPGLCTFLIFADYASTAVDGTPNINCVLLTFSCPLLTLPVSARGSTTGSWGRCSDWRRTQGRATVGPGPPT